ncbi:3-hydroxyacyl-CoA dehydrogenase [Seongchinamella sediminis]|uniref:3-hydroxyacyl-CoA dehydrogenase n=1 Tax=Seongchinamella sediminis TaxID=2283635 RepID=A0A3L7DYE7_9GAMM|nr:3-hydroxyacyl-CoA dehydrogenase [Seongchinamella sediminis]RLQ22274.1 3-hydroxyacyl-CoA dehydrogenase [Seongchinamella sediminis]
MKINKVLIVGAGTMGQQISFQCAMHGFETVVYNHRAPSLEVCRQAHQSFATHFQQTRGVPAKDTDAALTRLSYSTDLPSACEDADLVNESILEDLAIKQPFYEQLCQYLPQSSIITTNTSTFLPSQLTGCITRPERFMALHFVVGIWDAPIAELMGHPGTSADTVATTTDFARAIGLVPISINKEQPGYVINSLLIPWALAAQSLVTNAVTSVEDVDRTWMISTGMAMGPFGLMDMIGLGTVHAVLSNLADASGDAQQRKDADYVQAHFIDQGKLGLKSGSGYYDYPDPAFSRPGFLG